MHQPYDSNIPQIDIYPRKMKAYVHTKTYKRIFIAASFVISKPGNYPNVYQQINGERGCGTYIMEYYSDIKKE